MDELLKFSEQLNLYRIFQDEKRLQMTDVSPKRKGININLHNCSEKRATGAEGRGKGRGQEERDVNGSNFVSQCADSPTAFPLRLSTQRILRRFQFSVASGPLRCRCN